MNRIRATAALLLAFAADAEAHRPSDAFLTLVVEGAQVHGQWEIALRDVALLADVDPNRDRAVTWGELRLAEPELSQALVASLGLAGDGQPCRLRVTDLLVHERGDGPYAWFALEGACDAAPAVLRLDYGLLFEIDPTHRGILVLGSAGLQHSAVLAPERASATFSLGDAAPLRLFLDYLREGIGHIWVGLDHVLFLLTLLLPAVLVRAPAGWHAAPQLRPVLWDVVRVVTAFTLAHSITLGLAALGVLRLPAVWVEPLIALSVLLAALNNLRPVFTRARWAMAFGFGLLHGFGFASVLGELGLPAGSRVLALAAFNLGVEAGQLAIVLVAVPLAFVLRDTVLYRRAIVGAGSFAIAAVALIWLAERVAPAGG